MSNLDFLKFLQQHGVVTVEYQLNSKSFLIYDAEGWNCASVQFDEEGNVIDK